MATIRLEQFDGPFDLLLELISGQELDITEVALSQVTEQFLSYLDQLEQEERTAELADFLVVGTKLLFLKSKRLLPQFLPEEEDESSLEDQLRRYKQFVEASKQIHEKWLAPARSIFRTEPPKKADGFQPPENVSVSTMERTMVQLIHRLAPPKPLPKTSIDRTVSLKEKVDTIRSFLKKRKRFDFFEIVGERHNKTDMIVSFLAMLELVKQKQVHLSQDGVFADISVERL